MSSDFEQRINNKIEAILENQARNDTEISRILEAVAGMIQVARSHEERLDRLTQQTEENSRLIAELRAQGQEQDERMSEQRESINALIRIVEGHVTNHP